MENSHVKICNVLHLQSWMIVGRVFGGIEEKLVGSIETDLHLYRVRRPADKRLTGNGGKLNTSQAEPVAASSWAVGQFLSFSCEAFI